MAKTRSPWEAHRVRTDWERAGDARDRQETRRAWTEARSASDLREVAEAACHAWAVAEAWADPGAAARRWPVLAAAMTRLAEALRRDATGRDGNPIQGDGELDDVAT